MAVRFFEIPRALCNLMVVRGLPRLAAGVDLALVVRPGRLERLPTTPPVHQAVGSPRFKAKRGHGVRVREIRQNQKNVCINIIYKLDN